MNKPAFKDHRGQYIRTLTIERERNITNHLKATVGAVACHCAVGFLIERAGCHPQVGDDNWFGRVYRANDYIHDRQEREAKLTELFAEKGIRLKFKGERYSRRGRNR